MPLRLIFTLLRFSPPPLFSRHLQCLENSWYVLACLLELDCENSFVFFIRPIYFIHWTQVTVYNINNNNKPDVQIHFSAVPSADIVI